MHIVTPGSFNRTVYDDIISGVCCYNVMVHGVYRRTFGSNTICGNHWDTFLIMSDILPDYDCNQNRYVFFIKTNLSKLMGHMMMNRFSSMYIVNYKCGYNDYDDMELSDLT